MMWAGGRGCTIYVMLTSSSTHQVKLVNILELTQAMVVVNKELCGQLARLRQMLEDYMEDGTWKMMTKL